MVVLVEGQRACLCSVASDRDVDDVDDVEKCDDRSFNAVLNPLPRRSIAALSFYKKKKTW